MFLADVTVIDLAYITPIGTILGSSLSPKFVVSGDVTKDESVVVDFGKIKKKIKALIDDRDHGYDHKLWLFDNSDIKPFVVKKEEEKLAVETDFLKLLLPEDAVRVIEAPCANMLDMGVLDCCVEVDIENYLTLALQEEYPGIEVECKISFCGASMADGTNGAAWFRYQHGLKNSSSFGCQNSSHGHLSYIQLLDMNKDYEHVRHPVVKRMADAYNGTVFLSRENVVDETSSFVEIEYCSLDRGVCKAIYDKTKIRTKVLPTETTIEYLVDHMKREWWAELKDCGATHLAVSEGLSKGALIELT